MDGLGLDKDELEKLMHKSELFFDEGYVFERINLANIVALERLKKAKDTDS